MREQATRRERRGDVRSAGLSDKGKVRPANEDAFAMLSKQGLFIVSDGMGGHQAGATASEIVVRVLPKMLQQRVSALRGNAERAVCRALRDTIVALSQNVRQQSAGQPGLAGMGATVVLAWIRNREAFIAHMGDSRAYLYRGEKLKQLTADHSVVGILLRRREITPEEARVHPARSQISRYVGMDGLVYPDVRTLRLSSGDRLLLCTDGLTGMVSDKTIARILGRYREPEAACRSLVDAANAKGGHDNVTVLVADWTAPGRSATPTREPRRK
jgi:protein phosphatase